MAGKGVNFKNFWRESSLNLKKRLEKSLILKKYLEN